MTITRIGSEPTQVGPAEYFTGHVILNMPFQGDSPSSLVGATVSFDPGARTHWHTHPVGQTLLVIAGMGWIQSWGGVKQTVNPGDIVEFAPGEKHWHGATVNTSMSHIAVQDAQDGKTATWLEPVTEEQYLGS